MQGILCLTPREVVNASRRIRSGALKNYYIDHGPCRSCRSNGKIYRFKFGERAGDLVHAVMVGGIDGCLICAEDLFKRIKRSESELTDEEFESRLKLFKGKGTDCVYEYRPPVRRRKHAAHANPHSE